MAHKKIDANREKLIMLLDNAIEGIGDIRIQIQDIKTSLKTHTLVRREQKKSLQS